MTVPARLSIVTLGVSDLPRSTAFYQSLGWEPMAGGDSNIIMWFQTNGSVIGLFPVDELAVDTGVPPEPLSGFRGVTLAMNFSSEAEVDAMYAEFEAAGATAVKRPVKTEWGGYSSFVADPDGHYWELACVPEITLDADGRVLSFSSD